MTSAADASPDQPDKESEAEGDPPARREVTQAVTLASAVLLGGRSELQIEHRGEIYTLRLTRNGKLILTK